MACVDSTITISCRFCSIGFGAVADKRWTYRQMYPWSLPSPKAIQVPETVDELAKDYMYFACIKFVNSVRT